MDISTLSYDDWLKFVFDHPVHDKWLSSGVNRPVGEPPWYFLDEWQYDVSDPSLILSYLTRLFRNPTVLLDRFSLPQIDQGFWFIPESEGLMWTILLPNVAWDIRRSAIRSIEDLFELLFAKVKVETATYMWGDSLISSCGVGKIDVISDRAVLREIVDVIAKLNSSSSSEVRHSAQHGIEHLAAIAEKENDLELNGLLKARALSAPSL